jgi:hypothetical protein
LALVSAWASELVWASGLASASGLEWASVSVSESVWELVWASELVWAWVSELV